MLAWSIIVVVLHFIWWNRYKSFYSKIIFRKSLHLVNTTAQSIGEHFLIKKLAFFQCFCNTLFRKKGSTPVFSTTVAFKECNISFPSSYLQDCGRDQFRIRAVHDHYHRKQFLSTDKSYETMMNFL